MLQILGGGLLEAVNLTTLRVHARHDVLDRAVLAGGVDGLKDQEQGIAVIGVEDVLHLRQFGEVAR